MMGFGFFRLPSVTGGGTEPQPEDLAAEIARAQAAEADLAADIAGISGGGDVAAETARAIAAEDAIAADLATETARAQAAEAGLAADIAGISGGGGGITDAEKCTLINDPTEICGVPTKAAYARNTGIEFSVSLPFKISGFRFYGFAGATYVLMVWTNAVKVSETTVTATTTGLQTWGIPAYQLNRHQKYKISIFDNNGYENLWYGTPLFSAFYANPWVYVWAMNLYGTSMVHPVTARAEGAYPVRPVLTV